MNKKYIIYGLIIVAFITTLIAIFKVCFEPTVIENNIKEKITKAINNYDFESFMECVESTDSEYIYNIIDKKLENACEKIENISEDDFNKLTDFFEKINTSENACISMEIYNNIDNQLGIIEYNYYIKNAENRTNNQETIEYYYKALLVYKDDKNNETLFNEAKQKYASIIEKTNEILINNIDNYIENEDYDNGYDYIMEHDQEIKYVQNAVYNQRWETLISGINISWDDEGKCELIKKREIIFAKKKENDNSTYNTNENVIMKGMTKQQIVSVCGEPKKNNISHKGNLKAKNKGVFGSYDEFWYYSKNGQKFGIYFLNEKVVGISAEKSKMFSPVSSLTINKDN